MEIQLLQDALQGGQRVACDVRASWVAVCNNRPYEYIKGAVAMCKFIHLPCNDFPGASLKWKYYN